MEFIANKQTTSPTNRKEIDSAMPPLESQDVQLFVYFAWETRSDSPLLGDDQIRQAAHQAIQTHVRARLCRVLAIDSTPCQVHLLVSFPASMPIKTIVSISREAAQDAIFRHQTMFHGGSPEIRSLWARDFTAHTVSAAEAAKPQAYLQQKVGNFHLAAPQAVEPP